MAVVLREDFDLKAPNLQALSSRERVVELFTLLGYNTDARLAQTTEAMGLTADTLKHQMRSIERIADQENGALQVYLAEMRSVTVANTQALARSLKNRGTSFLWVLTSDYERLDFVLFEPTLPLGASASGIGFKGAFLRPRVLTVSRRNPTSIDLRVLRRFSYTEADADYQFQKLQSAYNIADWTEEYFNNRALFSDYYLKHRLQERSEWRENPAPTMRTFHAMFAEVRSRLVGQKEEVIRTHLFEPAFQALGFTFQSGKMGSSDTIEPDYYLYAPNDQSKPLAYCSTYIWDRTLDGRDETRDTETPDENPGAMVVSLLDREGAPEWAIVTNGKLWRLYSARAHSRATNYYEIDLEEALASPDPSHAFRYFWLLFRAGAFSEGVEKQSFLNRLLDSSALYAKELEDRLKDRVFAEIFPRFAEGFITDIRTREGTSAELGAERLNQVFHGTLTFLYRLLFLLYAEARDLLPVNEQRGYHGKSLTRLKADVAKDAGNIEDQAPARLEKAYSSHSTKLYDRLMALFVAIDAGDPNLNVPLYNGGLFSTQPADEDTSPEAASARFLMSNKIPDRYLAHGLDLLSRDVDAKTQALAFIDYKSLGVRQLGSVYEGLLEFKLRVAQEPMVVVKGKKTEEVSPEREATGKVRERLPKGAVYLENDKRERKASGSYYTPDYIVKYIVAHTVGPVLEEKMEALRPNLREAQRKHSEAVQRQKGFQKQGMQGDDPEKVANTYSSVVDELFDLRVLDPAMGSGHFLVEAVDFITDNMLKFLNAFPWNPVIVELRRTRESILGEMERQGVSIDPARLTDVNLLKRHVLKRCIYGVDLNPMAVELAKVSLWLDSFTLGAPLSFLDHHLKCGNSLIGVWVEEAREAIEFKELEQLSLFSTSQFAGIMLATDLMRRIGELEDVTAEQVRQSRSEFLKAMDALAPFKRILDVYASRWFGNEPMKAKRGSASTDRAIDFLRSSESQGWLSDPGFIGHLNSEQQRVATNARKVSQELRFFHWELEFPEVFFGPGAGSTQAIALRETGGFDAVIGNPPYDVLAEKEREEDLSSLDSYFADQPDFAPVMGRKIDLFRLFIARGINLTANDGYLGLIIPMSLLADQQAAPLRKHLLMNHRLIGLEAFPQKDDAEKRIFRDAKLPTCVVTIMSKPDDEEPFFVSLHPGKLLEEISGHYTALPSDIEAFDSTSLVIPLVASPVAFGLAKRLSLDSRFVQFDELAPTFQGEINETTMHALLSDDPSDGPKVLRGGNIQRYEFWEDPKQGATKYLKLKDYKRIVQGGRARHSTQVRFGYQRNAALDNWRRLIFGPLPTPCHCFDSVSYLLAEGATTYFYLAILNSSLQEWRFRLTSSNNHISTDEIASLPIRRINFTTTPAHRTAMDEKARKLYERCVSERSHEYVLGFVEHHLSQQPEEADVVHDLLAFLAEKMLGLNKEKQATQKRLLGWLESTIAIRPDNKGNTGLDALTGKSMIRSYLGDYQKSEAERPFTELQRILFQNKAHIGVSLSDAGLMKRIEGEYEASLAVLRPIKAQLAFTDSLIDQVVYKLYGLTEEEIAIVEGAQSKEEVAGHA